MERKRQPIRELLIWASVLILGYGTLELASARKQVRMQHRIRAQKERIDAQRAAERERADAPAPVDPDGRP